MRSAPLRIIAHLGQRRGEPMSALDVAAKTERDPASCWETPEWLVERVRAAFGGVIDLDPCTTPQNPVGALRFFAPPEDGIALSWSSFGMGHRIYCNPPYGRTIRHWTEKCGFYASAGREIILLVPARTDANWWHELQANATATVFLRGRISFKNAGGSPKFPSALVGLNHDLAQLADLGWRVKGTTE
jgi:phage N-6-adenine-methyltransferase